MATRLLCIFSILAFISCSSDNDETIDPLVIEITDLENPYGKPKIVGAYIESEFSNYNFESMPFNTEKMTFELGAPPSRFLTSFNFFLAEMPINTTGIVISNGNARWSGELTLYVYDDSERPVLYDYLKHSVNSWNDDYEFWTKDNAFIKYCYVDRDVSISGSLSGFYRVVVDVTFTKGWNVYAQYRSHDDDGNTRIRYSSQLPSGTKWRL